VAVSELVTGVNIALGTMPLSRCPVFDWDGDGAVTVSELVKAVRYALEGCPLDADNEVQLGLYALAAGDLRAANESFRRAVTTSPQDSRANLYFALTRIGVKALDDPQLIALRQRAGITVQGDSQHVCDLDASVPDPLPATTARSQEILETVRAVMLPELVAARENLARIPTDVTIAFPIANLPECARPETDVSVAEIDRADVLALDAALSGAAAVLEMTTAYDVDLGLQAARDLKPQALFQQEPGLLKTLRSADRLLSARQHLDNTFGKLVQVIDAVRGETDDQTDDIITIDPDEVDDARRIRLLLSLFQQSLHGPVTLPIDVVTGEVVLVDIGLLPQERLNLDLLFSGTFSNLRQFLPGFDEDGDFDTGRFPDVTVGGVVPDMTQYKLDNFLVGGPPCAPCDETADCDPLGVADFYCGYCFQNCSGAPRRCTEGYAVCADGTFY
jgi:hypothetical protein